VEESLSLSLLRRGKRAGKRERRRGARHWRAGGGCGGQRAFDLRGQLWGGEEEGTEGENGSCHMTGARVGVRYPGRPSMGGRGEQAT
jgi:hypothetical protein